MIRIYGAFLKGLRPLPHLLFVLTQKVGKKLKAAFQKPKNYARKLKPCKLDRSATAPPVSNNAWLFTLSSLVFLASETQGLSRAVFIFTPLKHAFKSHAKTAPLKGCLLFSVTRTNVFYYDADLRSILKGLRPLPHLLFVLTQKVGKKLKVAFPEMSSFHVSKYAFKPHGCQSWS
jgi:hypothetical protein